MGWNGLPVALRLTPVDHSALFQLELEVGNARHSIMWDVTKKLR